MMETFRQIFVFGSYAMIVGFCIIVVAVALRMIIRPPKFKPGKDDRFVRTNMHDLTAEIGMAAYAAAVGTGKTAVKKSEQPTEKRRAFIVNFIGDLHCSAVDELANQISLILLTADEQDEVFLRLMSPGGTVTGYSLATQQLKRLREKKITLTTSVDQVAASGGYMMSCVADTVIAAPDAIIGSIGTAVDMPNFHQLLETVGIRFFSFHAGKRKRMLSPFKPVGRQGKAWVMEKLERHFADFKQHVADHRKEIDIEAVGNGDYWTAREALEMKLVDRIQTGDEWIFERYLQGWQLYELRFEKKYSMLGKLIHATAEAFVEVVWARIAKHYAF